MRRRGKGGLTEEDKALWGRVAATANPMNPKTQPAEARSQSISRDVAQRSDNAATVDRLPAFRVGEKASFSSGPVNHTPTMSARLAEAPVRIDQAVHKRMVRGKLKPEARIDLHGMTLTEAHPALIRFVLAAHQADRRLVLVITGKGKDRDDAGPIPIRRGILRHQVPSWLISPPLGALVLDIREAHRRHGGGGAYYVYLKRKR